MRARTAGPTKDAVTGLWGFCVDVGADADGNRKQARRRGYQTKKAAQEELDKLRVAVTKQEYVAPTTKRLGEWLDEWLASVAGDVEQSTLSSYTRYLRVHVRPRLGGVQLRHLDPVAIKTMYNEIGETRAPRTVRYVHAILSHALKDAVELGCIPKNPCDKAKPPKKKKSQKREMTTWTAKQVRAFFDLPDVKVYRDRVAWWVAVNTGLRRGELLGLRWRDVDLDTKQLTIVQTCAAIDHKIVITPGTKTEDGGNVSIDAVTAAELKAHRAQRIKDQMALGIALTDTSLVFANPDGSPLDPDRFSERFIRMTERHPELPRLRFHDLRHSHATILLRAGVPLVVVAKRLRNSVEVCGDVYSHVNPEMQLDAAERAAALLANA